MAWTTSGSRTVTLASARPIFSLPAATAITRSSPRYCGTSKPTSTLPDTGTFTSPDHRATGLTGCTRPRAPASSPPVVADGPAGGTTSVQPTVSKVSTPRARRAKIVAKGSGLSKRVSDRMPSSTAATVAQVGPSVGPRSSSTARRELERTSAGAVSVSSWVKAVGSTVTERTPKARSGRKACAESRWGSFTRKAVT